MKWPWRREHDCTHAQATKAEAAEWLDKAKRQSESVARAARSAREVARHTDRFTRDVERALRPREH